MTASYAAKVAASSDKDTRADTGPPITPVVLGTGGIDFSTPLAVHVFVFAAGARAAAAGAALNGRGQNHRSGRIPLSPRLSLWAPSNSWNSLSQSNQSCSHRPFFYEVQSPDDEASKEGNARYVSSAHGACRRTRMWTGTLPLWGHEAFT